MRVASDLWRLQTELGAHGSWSSFAVTVRAQQMSKQGQSSLYTALECIARDVNVDCSGGHVLLLWKEEVLPLEQWLHRVCKVHTRQEV